MSKFIFPLTAAKTASKQNTLLAPYQQTPWIVVLISHTRPGEKHAA